MQPPVVASNRRSTATPGTRPANSTPEWAKRWLALRRARDELRQWIENSDAVVTAFNREIAPRERLLTRSLTDLTAQLITVIQRDSRDGTDNGLLAQWIVENLTILRNHPFAETERVRVLAATWRSYIAPDAAQDSNHDTVHDSCCASPNTARKAAHTDRSRSRAGAAGYQTSAGSKSAHNDDADKSSAENGAEEPASIRPNSVDVNANNLIAPLFRRLAQALHPDREPDTERRIVKQKLMQEALDARENQDIDTLLSLHVEHVGQHLDILEGLDAKALLGALERQMESVQKSLRTRRFGNHLKRDIVERYGFDPERRRRLIQDHSRDLDDAIATVQTTCTQVRTTEGLDEALTSRRDALLDQQTINELTGVC